MCSKETTWTWTGWNEKNVCELADPLYDQQCNGVMDDESPTTTTITTQV